MLMAAYGIQRAVWQDSGSNTLKMKRLNQNCCPAASASMPLPRQAAGALVAPRKMKHSRLLAKEIK